LTYVKGIAEETRNVPLGGGGQSGSLPVPSSCLSCSDPWDRGRGPPPPFTRRPRPPRDRWASAALYAGAPRPCGPSRLPAV